MISPSLKIRMKKNEKKTKTKTNKPEATSIPRAGLMIISWLNILYDEKW